MRRAQQGDRAAYGELMRRYQRPLYGFAYRLLQASEEAADLTQETLVRGWQYLARFDPARPFRPWLFRIALNRAASWKSRNEGRETVPLEDLTSDPAAPDDVPGALEQHEVGQRVRLAIAELSPQQQQAIVLVELEGFAANQAAEVMGCSPATVRQHVFRAKKRLRVLLEGYLTGSDEVVQAD